MAQRSLYAPRGLTLQNSTFCPHAVFMCFVWISEQTAIISLYNINWLVFINETECVYCAVRTGSSNVTQVKPYLQIGTGTRFFSRVPLFSPVNIVLPLLDHWLDINLLPHGALTRTATGQSPGAFHTAKLSRKSDSIK